MANRSTVEAVLRYSLTAGIPAQRIGWLLGQARVRAGLSERDLAREAGVRKRVVRRWETAREIPCDREIASVARACGIDLDELLPPRDILEFDAEARSMRVGAAVVSLAEVDNDAILSTYVALVRDQRSLKMGDVFTFRQQDLDALCDALDLDDDDLENRLVRATGIDAEQAAEIRRKMLRRRLALPAVGLLAGSSIGLVRAVDTGLGQDGRGSEPAAIVVTHETRQPTNSDGSSTSIDPVLGAAVVVSAPAPTTAAVAAPSAALTVSALSVAAEPAAESTTEAAIPEAESTPDVAPSPAPARHTSPRPVAPAPAISAETIAAPAAVEPEPAPAAETAVAVEIGTAASVDNLAPRQP